MSVQVIEKIELNKQVVQMRKYVKQAKVYTINKLVKEVKLLQNRKGNDTQIAKAKRKAERFLEEISILKKIKPDDVSKLALSKSKDWKDILQKKTSTLEDRSLALLANYDTVQKEVENFHSSNPDLVCKIPELVKEWQQKSKFSKSSPKPFLREKNKLDRNTEDKYMPELFGKEVNKGISSKNVQSLQKENEDDCDINDNVLNVLDRKETECDVLTEKDNKRLQSNIKKHLKKQHAMSEFPHAEKSEGKEVDKLYTDDLCSDDNVASDQDADIEGNKEHESEANDSENTDDDMEVITKAVNSKKKPITDDWNSDIFQKALKKRKMSEHKNVCVENMASSKISSTKSSMISASPKTLDNDQSNHFVQSDKILIENNLKTIAVLNLDDFQGLDEIPVGKTADNENESEEEEKNDSDKERSDPFFLGREDVDSVVESKSRGSSGNKRNLFKHSNPRERSGFIKNEKSNFRNMGKRDFIKSTSSQFSGKEFNKFADSNEINSERNFKRNYFQSINKDRLPDKSRNKFQSKDPRDLNRKERRSLLATGKRPFEKKLNKSHFKGEDSSLFKREEIQSKRDNVATSKPLHPSWEAKKKQKELAQTSFTGKRMVFND